jgi:hypothetical protein
MGTSDYVKFSPIWDEIFILRKSRRLQKAAASRTLECALNQRSLNSGQVVV